MFHPSGHPMERGWVGRVDGDRVVHLAAQTLQSYFLGGGGAREHNEYALADVVFLAPVLHPPTVRVFEREDAFAFANASAVVGPGATVDGDGDGLELHARVAAVVGADEQIGGMALLAEWRCPARPVPKDRDFALALGPFVVTGTSAETGLVAVVGGSSSEHEWRAFDWERARSFAGANTTLRPGDLLAGPAHAVLDVPAGALVELTGGGLGTLALASSGQA
jgi:hypothetical protein